MLPSRIFLKSFVQIEFLLFALSVYLVFHLLELSDSNLDGLLLNQGLLFSVIALFVCLICPLGLRCIYVRQTIGLDMPEEPLEDPAPDLVHE